MSDTVDEANDAVELELTNKINLARGTPDKRYYKYCLNCGEPTMHGNKFCDKDCADDYEKIQRAKIMRKI